MTAISQIHRIANKLANQGKKPTVALIKNNLTSPLPLPKIISALKSWSYDPNMTTEHENKTAELTSKHLAESQILSEAALADMMKNVIEKTVAQEIDKAITPLKQEIIELKALLKTLSSTTITANK
ncbi:MAG: hypothetical protein ACSHW0_06955 [Thalassotalea sp.]